MNPMKPYKVKKAILEKKETVAYLKAQEARALNDLLTAEDARREDWRNAAERFFTSLSLLEEARDDLQKLEEEVIETQFLGKGSLDRSSLTDMEESGGKSPPRWMRGTGNVTEGGGSIPEIIKTVIEKRPVIAHLSGRSVKTGEMVLKGENGEPFPVRAQTVTKIIAENSPETRLCFFGVYILEGDAEAAAEYIDAVVSLRADIGHDKLVAFIKRFYAPINGGKSLQAAMAAGLSYLKAAGVAERDLPALHLKKGVDAAALILTGR